MQCRSRQLDREPFIACLLTVTISIIGAGGFVGTHLRAALTARGASVMAVSSADGGFDTSSGILMDLPVNREIEAVVYLSQSPHYRDLPRMASHVWAVNVLSAVKAVVWARQCGAQRFLYASTGSVYAPSFEPHREEERLRRDEGYALSKVQGEEAVAAFGNDIRVIRARLFSVYGPLQKTMLLPRLVETLRAGRPVRLHPHPTDPTDAGGLRLSLSYVDDVVDAMVTALTADVPSIFNASGSQVVSIRALAGMVGRQLGVEPRFEIESPPRVYDLIADASRMRAILGRETVPVEVGVARAVGERESARQQP